MAPWQMCGGVGFAAEVFPQPATARSAPMAAAQNLGMEYAAPVAAEEPPAAARRPGAAQVEVPTAPLGLVALHNLWKSTKGTLSLDLKRRQLKGGAPGDTLWRVQPQGSGGEAGRRPRRVGHLLTRTLPDWRSCCGQFKWSAAVKAASQLHRAAACLPRCCRGRPPLRAHAAPTYYQPTAPPGAYAAGGRAYGSAPGGGSLLDLPSFSFMDTGARVKVMRHLQAREFANS